MNKQILKPSWSKIVGSWLVMAFVVLVFTILFNLKEFTDIVGLALVIVVLLFQTFVFCAIFYSLPFFKIEITDSHVSGLRSFAGWDRAQISIEDIDTQNVNAKFQWLGYYVLKSKTGKKILVCAFDEKQFKKLITIINDKKGPAQ